MMIKYSGTSSYKEVGYNKPCYNKVILLVPAALYFLDAFFTLI